jgi:hypothetical protein
MPRPLTSIPEVWSQVAEEYQRHVVPDFTPAAEAARGLKFGARLGLLDWAPEGPVAAYQPTQRRLDAKMIEFFERFRDSSGRIYWQREAMCVRGVRQ